MYGCSYQVAVARLLFERSSRDADADADADMVLTDSMIT